MELQQLIGTETCSYCSVTSECISLPEEDGEPRASCEPCILKAFREYWGQSKLYLDVDFETARSLHRVVRAMHDGECPKCHTIHSSDAMQQVRVKNNRSPNDGYAKFAIDLRCPACGFIITDEEKQAAITTFAPVMEKNLEVFDQWRQKL